LVRSSGKIIKRVAYWQGVTFSDESPYTDKESSPREFVKTNCIPLIAKEKNIIINNKESFGYKGIRKEVRENTNSKETAPLEAETQPHETILATKTYAGRMPKS